MIILPDFTPFAPFLAQYTGPILVWGWLLVVCFILTIAWETYQLLKRIDYIVAIQWTYLQITVPDDSPYTPKSMENAFDVWGGIHKSPDMVERFFDGYIEPWYSCELHCQLNRARYIMVVPTPHRKFFEGVIYGQYPNSEIREVEDYTLRYDFQRLEKDFDAWGSEIILAEKDIYPVKTYREYEDTLAEDDKYVDPHQALIEAYTNIREGEEFWVQILIRPRDSKVIKKWAEGGEEQILKIAGRGKDESEGMLRKAVSLAAALPTAILHAAFKGPLEAEDAAKEKQQRFVFTALEDARMKGILDKVSHTGYKTKIRVVNISLPGKLYKPSQSVAVGAFKQFGTFHLNSFKPDKETKSNGPSYFFKNSRRKLRKRNILLNFQWRDFWGDESGFMMTADELATIYHFPVKYLKAPVVERAASGLSSAPDNVPFI